MLVNIVELLFQLMFMLFLLLRSTRDIVDDYLVFPYHSNLLDEINKNCTDNADTGVATLTWLLLPFAYFPLIVSMILIIVKLGKKAW